MPKGGSMERNYHTHTPRCNHAFNTEREFVEGAIEAGMKVLGFSDHSPYIFDGDYYSTFRMRPEMVEDYVTSILRLKEEYKRDIEIHVGLEMEYYPKYFERLCRFLEDFPLEYALLGQHCMENEIGAHYSGTYTEDFGLLQMFVDQMIEAFSVGKWLYVAHPDILNYPYNRPEYRTEMRRLCVAAKERGIPLEINLLGLKTRRSYPNRPFWETAAEVGNEVVLGVDAHKVEWLVMPEIEEEAMGWVRELGLKMAPDFELGVGRHIGLR